jgi:hypothetical protein
MMTKSRSDKLHFAETFSKPPRSDHSLWPIGTCELASLVDLGLSDDRIARYFGVEQAKVSALRVSYGLADPRNQSDSLES